MGYYPFYFKGYGILFILLLGIWDTVFNIFVTFWDIGNFENMLMVIFACLQRILARLLQGKWDIVTPYTRPIVKADNIHLDYINL